MKIYHAKRGRDRVILYVIDDADPTKTRRYISHRTGRDSHSPTGFEWGYLGSGPAELAFALVRDMTGKQPSPYVYQRFKEKALAGLPRDVSMWKTSEAEFRVILDPIIAEYEAQRF